jgi:hypothetical protein
MLEESCPEGGPFVMSDSRENFDAWFVNVLESLYPRREAGFVILMIAFPLLERYLRQRVGLPAEDDRLTTNFYDELRKLFPKLRDSDQARAFWQIYRNGLLHQGTFSQKRIIYGLASHDISDTIYIDQNKGIFCVHPVLFARQVLEQIRNDFATYEGASSVAPPLSTVGPYQFAPETPMIVGTSVTASGDWSGSPSKPPPGRLSSQVC